MSKLYEVLAEIKKEKGIEEEVLINIMKEELVRAYRNYYGNIEKICAIITSKETKLVITKKVTNIPKEKIKDVNLIDLSSAKKINHGVKVNSYIDIEIETKKLTPSITINAKQAVIKRIKQIEKQNLINEFSPKINNIITGRVQKINKNILVDLGKIEGVLPYHQRVRGEQYKIGDRIRTYALEVIEKEDTIQLLLSRTDKEMVRLLFQQEIPEINKSIIEIVKIEREAGLRTKVVVSSKDESIDPVGTCVGIRGTRIQAIMDELNGERIDVIRFTDNLEEFIKSCMTPAKITKVIIQDTNVTVLVPENQLPLAIGKYGHNVRLATKLIGFPGLQIKVKTEAELTKEKIKAELFKE